MDFIIKNQKDFDKMYFFVDRCKNQAYAINTGLAVQAAGYLDMDLRAGV
jgi:hypothetical protein